jgi:hypothetical protein
MYPCDYHSNCDLTVGRRSYLNYRTLYVDIAVVCVHFGATSALPGETDNFRRQCKHVNHTGARKSGGNSESRLGGYTMIFWKTAYFCMMAVSGSRLSGWRPCGPENQCVCDPDDETKKE